MGVCRCVVCAPVVWQVWCVVNLECGVAACADMAVVWCVLGFRFGHAHTSHTQNNNQQTHAKRQHWVATTIVQASQQLLWVVLGRALPSPL